MIYDVKTEICGCADTVSDFLTSLQIYINGTIKCINIKKFCFFAMINKKSTDLHNRLTAHTFVLDPLLTLSLISNYQW